MTAVEVAAAVFTLIGIGILIGSVWSCVCAWLSRRWPEATGCVIASELEKLRDSDGGYGYRAAVSYRYSVGSEFFVSSRTRFGDRFQYNWLAPAARLVRKYPVDTPVTVRYDPDDPGRAVLEPGLNWLVFAGLALGITFIVLGVQVFLRTL